MAGPWMSMAPHRPGGSSWSAGPPPESDSSGANPDIPALRLVWERQRRHHFAHQIERRQHPGRARASPGDELDVFEPHASPPAQPNPKPDLQILDDAADGSGL